SVTCESLVDIPGESIKCFCENRTMDRVTTNGLCRRKGTRVRTGGTIDLNGVCVGTAAIQPTTRQICLSEMQFKTGTCVANVVYFNSVGDPSFVGSCGTNQRNVQETYCSTTPDFSLNNCPHSKGNFGWTRAFDDKLCMGQCW
ncbi:hypothetical protein PMAYCL1PPCAC_22282, partial [Pristionchus mayeri]